MSGSSSRQPAPHSRTRALLAATRADREPDGSLTPARAVRLEGEVLVRPVHVEGVGDRVVHVGEPTAGVVDVLGMAVPEAIPADDVAGAYGTAPPGFEVVAPGVVA